MKRYLISMIALALCIGMAQANPVGVSQAKYVGQQFVQANFDQSRNVGNEGYVMVSADDFYRPILGYSDEGIFDAQNINPNLGYMLNRVIESRSDKFTGEPTPKVAAEWQNVMITGKLVSRNGNRTKFYLVQTKWDKNYPYNYYCPEAPGGPGGHVDAGCVATAMSQMMKYWNHPLQGTGSHTDYNSGFGPLTANFGETTYDWDNMPNSINANSPQVQIDAVATLIYHCGIAVDMHYAIGGSGAYSQDVPSRIYQYFSYTNQAVSRSRDNYTYENWANMMKESLDMGWPLYYSGQSSQGGHAFICDGYDENGLFHFNWGWGGSGDNYFDFDNIDYNSSDGAIFNFVPTYVYNSTAQAPTNLTVTPAPNYGLSATVSWTNPSKALNNSNLTTIDQIVVCRNGEIIYTENNVTPGANMTIADNSVPRFDAFDYTVYAICGGGNHGQIAYLNKVNFGPTCGWIINVTQASYQGFRGGAIHVYNSAGTEVAQMTTTNSSIQSFPIDVPLGHVSFGWTAQTNGESFTMAFTIKNSQNSTVYTYAGSSADMPEGVFFTTNNSCGGQPGAGVPSNLFAMVDSENNRNINVSWDGVNDSGYGYVVYRDNLMYRLIPNATSFVDENVAMGGHCYYVSFLSDGGENGHYSNESCASSGECYAPRNFDYEYTGNNKIKLLWERPEPSDGLSGYYLFRRTDDTEYIRIKLLGANATSYTDNTANVDGTWYYYKLYAHYEDLDCESAPASWIHDNNQFYLRVYYSSTGVNYYITVIANPDYGGTVSGEGTYAQGSTCYLNAYPNSGYSFEKWTKDGSQVSTNPNYSFTVASDASYVAHFQQSTTNYTITATVNPSNSGTVTGTGTYASGSTCTLQAWPNSGYTFVNWLENGVPVSTNPTYSFTVTGNRNLVAVFDLSTIYYTITASAEPANGGSVSGDGTYASGSTCTLHATPNSGYSFEKWTKNGTQVSTNPDYSFTVTSNASYVAHFSEIPQEYTITAVAEPAQGGAVSGAGIYPAGSTCVLTAMPNEGYVFENWTRGSFVVSTDPSYSFVVNDNVEIVAHFTQDANHFTITAIAAPVEGGAISGSGTYEMGTTCTLNAIAAVGYEFVKWTLNGSQVSTEPSFSFTVTSNAVYTAHFERIINHYTVAASVEPAAAGSVSGTGTYQEGATCTLTATANPTYSFVNWTENGVIVSTNPTYSFTVNSNRSFVAVFSQGQFFTITASASGNGTISPEGDVFVEPGADKTFAMIPNSGCRVGRVIVDGVDIGPVESYTFRSVNSNHSIYVQFSGVGVDENLNANLKVYPNPAKESLVVEGEDMKRVAVFNLLGVQMASQEVNDSHTTINTNGFIIGTYILKVEYTDGKIGYSRFVVAE